MKRRFVDARRTRGPAQLPHELQGGSARISASVAGGSKFARVLIFRHMGDTLGNWIIGNRVIATRTNRPSGNIQSIPDYQITRLPNYDRRSLHELVFVRLRSMPMKQTAPALPRSLWLPRVPAIHAHFKLVEPASWIVRRPARRSAENRPVRWLAAAAAQRTRCCGSPRRTPRMTRSNAVTKVTGGSKIHLRWRKRSSILGIIASRSRSIRGTAAGRPDDVRANHRAWSTIGMGRDSEPAAAADHRGWIVPALHTAGGDPHRPRR